jgi:outer membrane protein OmpA-like peptidoglycan-associated protein
MHRIVRWLLGVTLAAMPLAAQQNVAIIGQAQQALAVADSAGAQIYAKSLYDDAAYRIRFAQENMSSTDARMQAQAVMRAREALFAAEAARAKARWLGTNATIANLQADIRRFGGTSTINPATEDPNIDYHRGSTTADRIAAAQAAIDQAKSAGAEQSVADNDLKTAQSYVDSARKAASNTDVADYLAYIGEMIARRAYYMAQFNTSACALPDVQLQRTRLAQTSSEQQANAERTQREEAQRRAAELQAQLTAEAANRQAQTAEIEQLRQQVEENRRALQQRVENDRAARIQAEKDLDASMRAYESSALTANQADLDRLRRDVEDKEIALKAIQDRERLDAQAIAADVTAMKNSPNPPQDMIASRQSELDQYQSEINADVSARNVIQQHHEAAIAAAQQQRQQAEAQAAAMRQQVEQAQQALVAAQQQAAQTQQQLQAAQQQAAQQQQQAQQAQQQLTQQVQQSQADAEKARQAAQAAQAELEKTREELARKDAEARQLRMQQELARIAATKAESRGIVVTLPGIFFDPGKSTLKPGAKKTLDRIAEQLTGDSAIKVSVEGHTDSVGKAEKNLELSQKRAEAVRQFLISKGVPETQIIAVGKGETEPIATNKTVAGRQQNRRVELVITRS